MNHCKYCLEKREMWKAKGYFTTAEKLNNNEVAQKGMSVAWFLIFLSQDTCQFQSNTT